MTGTNNSKVTEDMVSRYHELYKKSKRIEKEMSDLKKQFHDFFDENVGPETKGELEFDGYKLQRQIRKSESFISDATIDKLESLNLADCIQVIRKPHEEKIKSALTLGFITPSDLEDCIYRKISSAIVVKEK
ncbi:hypothetical protein JOC77_000585 [Peribacillus deserti]|uniref:RNA polymerase subunit sigma-70 n=1 Tax=Peribacillus deserti TaxID=673318 RepID=A0ABS2QDW9_9BACI|nr:hypothetical protein [Peribacillus deserti]MBM7691180.1 hypothetical protein [Peribacillus deserti]